jgi:hypothetical protein
LPNMEWKLLSSAVIKKVADKKVVYYKLEVTNNGEKYILKKRFSDFEMLDHLIKASFSGNHLQSSLPQKPGKSVALWTDHLDRRFVHLRRNELQAYLKKLGAMNKVLGNPDYAAFFAKTQNTKVTKIEEKKKNTEEKKESKQDPDV